MRPWIFISLLGLASTPAFAGGSIHCLKPKAGAAPRLQFSFPEGNGDVATILREKSSVPILAKRIRETELRNNGDRPSEIQSEWTAPGAKYVLTTQGALILKFKHVRGRNGKATRYVDDPESNGEANCTWAK